MMKDFYAIDTVTTYAAVAMLRMLAENSDITFRRARLNLREGFPDELKNSEDWPLIFECTSKDRDAREFEVRVHTLTSGYGGTGPHDLVQCLKIAGFENVDENQIFTETVINRIYEK